jgi:type IV secretory pathway VirB2 component (pilin)
MTENEETLRFLLRAIRGAYRMVAAVVVIIAIDSVISWPDLGFEEVLVSVIGIATCGLMICRQEVQRQLDEELGKREEAIPRDAE